MMEKHGKLGVDSNLSCVGGGDAVDGVRRDMEGWREVLIPISATLRWEKPYHPVILLGTTTVFFFLIWLCEVSALTTISLIAMGLGLLDFCVPYFGPSLTGRQTWTAEDEASFTQICVTVAKLKNEFFSLWDGFFNMRHHNSKVFFIFLMVSLSFTAWIGNLVHNLLLTYMFVSFCLCLPGLQRNEKTQVYWLRFVKTVNKLQSYIITKPKEQ